jgi:hypothetical protein
MKYKAENADILKIGDTEITVKTEKSKIGDTEITEISETEKT